LQIVKKYFFIFIGNILFLPIALNAQLIVASKTLVCPNQPFSLEVNDKALKAINFCVQPLANRFGKYYFRTCNQVSAADAVIMAKMMRGNLATANDDTKNNFLFNLLPNDLHWLGYVQNPKSRDFNDPPDPASGWEWMSKEPQTRPFWEIGEPNNLENSSPGMHIIQGCRRNASWCDEDGSKNYIGLIESTFSQIPQINQPTILWETGQTTRSINLSIQKSQYIAVQISYGNYSIKDSILIEIPEIYTSFSKPGGCNPYKWKPSLSSNAPLSDLEVRWEFGTDIIFNNFKPEFTTTLSGSTKGKLKVESKTCNTLLKDTLLNFVLNPMVSKAQVDTLVKLNTDLLLRAFNQGPFKYSWSPSNVLLKTQENETVYTAKNEKLIRLEVKDDFNCKVTESFLVKVDDRLKVFYPNVFTPNSDNINDTFTIFLEPGFVGNIELFTVYNKWGHTVHESKTLDWDGKNKGKVLPFDEYPFTIKYKVGAFYYLFKGSVLLSY
jgi:gliding motility-associated-like protein